MIEEQALCRVHHVGQKHNITSIRSMMRDLFEEIRRVSTFRRYKLTCLQQIVEILKRKQMLTKVAFGEDLLCEAGIELRTLQVSQRLHTCTILLIQI
jgi:hypothetical protein